MPRFLNLYYAIAEIDRSLRFYRALEFQERGRQLTETGSTFIFLGLPGEVDSRLVLRHDEDGEEPRPRGYSHLTIWVEDMDRARERLVEAEARPSEPSGRPGGQLRCSVSDPDGYWVVLIADDRERSDDPAIAALEREERARREAAVEPSSNKVLPRDSELGAEGVEALWREEFPEYPRLRHDGESSLIARVPPQKGIGEWMRRGRHHKAHFDPVSKEWTLPYAWRDEMIGRLANRYGGVLVLRDAAVTERCAPSCVKAVSPVTQCECSCGGANHGTGALPTGFQVINEALAVRVSPQRDVKITFIVPRNHRELTKLGFH